MVSHRRGGGVGRGESESSKRRSTARNVDDAVQVQGFFDVDVRWQKKTTTRGMLCQCVTRGLGRVGWPRLTGCAEARNGQHGQNEMTAGWMKRESEDPGR